MNSVTKQTIARCTRNQFALLTLSGDPSPAVRMQVVKNKYATPEILIEMLDDSDENIAIAAAKRLAINY